MPDAPGNNGVILFDVTVLSGTTKSQCRRKLLGDTGLLGNKNKKKKMSPLLINGIAEDPQLPFSEPDPV